MHEKIDIQFFSQTVLPASASDVYYRDDIGNISTSALRQMDDAVELDLRPRCDFRKVLVGWYSRDSIKVHTFGWRWAFVNCTFCYFI